LAIGTSVADPERWPNGRDCSLYQYRGEIGGPVADIADMVESQTAVIRQQPDLVAFDVRPQEPPATLPRHCFDEFEELARDAGRRQLGVFHQLVEIHGLSVSPPLVPGISVFVVD
jgi:hypothetical protein